MTSSKLYGALAEFESASAIYHACEKVRDAQFSKWDAFSPFPIHGIDHAMGNRRSILPYFVFVMGISGACLAMLLQWWTSAVDYPVIIAAKPYFSWQAFIPVTFEVMVLFSAGTAVLAMLFLNRLPRWHHPLMKVERFARVTDDRFFIAIESTDPKFNAETTPAFLRSLGASHVEIVED
ncbi:MAG: DUF3341 domain-containing protein [Myxococcales bacterium]|nr:DUF3341 domain-containing protein [Myxococcales bacterium]